MATYAIGDVQGCYAPLRRLLRELDFDARADELWFVGDLVNRGPASADVLRWCVDHDAVVKVVLGNHDLHLLARYAGAAKAKRRDTLEDVLEARDVDDLIGWLRKRPLAHYERGWLMVHAGVLPPWTTAQTVALARDVEHALRADDWADTLALLREPAPDTWSDELGTRDRLRVIAAALTRLRACTVAGAMRLDFDEGLDALPKGAVPWFAVPGRRTAGTPIVCGHWAALGVHLEADVAALDSGCVWGGALTAMRLSDRRLYSVPA